MVRSHRDGHAAVISVVERHIQHIRFAANALTVKMTVSIESRLPFVTASMKFAALLAQVGLAVLLIVRELIRSHAPTICCA
jgi:hypothetical protein